MPELEKPSERLIAQCVRNRVIEEIYGLAEWRETLKNVGFVEYFETFFDVFPYEGEPYPNEAMTEEERLAVRLVHGLMIKALNATPQMMSEDAFMATGWPERIEPVAEQTLRLMLKRGRFSQEQEEAEPSADDGWPWRERYSQAKS